jgi:hypothetical protein
MSTERRGYAPTASRRKSFAADRFDPGESASGDEDGEQVVALRGRALEVGLLQHLDQPVPEREGVTQRLHGERALLQAGEAKEVGDTAERQHQVIEGQLVLVPAAGVANHHPPALEVDPLHLAHEEHRAAHHPADRIHDVGDVEVARGHLVQHRREQDEVVAVDDGDLDLGIPRDGALQLDGGVHPGEPAAQDHDPDRLRRAHAPTPAASRGERPPRPAARTWRSSRSASATDQAWNGQPLGTCGGSASAISETWPTPAWLRWSNIGSRNLRRASARTATPPPRTLTQASTNGPSSQGQTVPW